MVPIPEYFVSFYASVLCLHVYMNVAIEESMSQRQKYITCARPALLLKGKIWITRWWIILATVVWTCKYQPVTTVANYLLGSGSASFHQNLDLNSFVTFNNLLSSNTDVYVPMERNEQNNFDNELFCWHFESY
jgi:hypothetical protein